MSNPRKRRRTDGTYSPNKRSKDIKCINDLLEYITDTEFENKKLANIYFVLNRINSMIGMNDFKKKLLDQIMYFVTGSDRYDNDGALMHTVIYGPPGTGKTHIATLIGQIYANLGFVKSSKVTYGKRSSFIAEYLGQTATKTLNFLKNATPGILIIDEVYSLGNSSRDDSYSQEAINVINQYLSEHKRDLVCIVVGYYHDVQNCFFSVNKGLERRFPFRYHIKDYNTDELVDIFKYQVSGNKWNVTDDVADSLKIIINNNKNLFKNYGGDTENLLFYCKLFRAKRLFDNQTLRKFWIEKEDLLGGFEDYKFNKNLVIEGSESGPPAFMYT